MTLILQTRLGSYLYKVWEQMTTNIASKRITRRAQKAAEEYVEDAQSDWDMHRSRYSGTSEADYWTTIIRLNLDQIERNKKRQQSIPDMEEIGLRLQLLEAKRIKAQA